MPESASPAPRRFGALIYKTRNLGDEIQTLAALRFLPRVDALIDRDNLASFSGREPISLILNGWFGERPSSWPPAPAIRPLLVSVHISPQPGTFDVTRVSASEFFLQEPASQYLRRYGPIGARDTHTLALLETHHIPAYFSGCLTLTLERQSDVTATEDVVLNDVPPEVEAFVRRQTRRAVHVTAHIDDVTPFGEARLAKARELLHRYQSAHLVITTRLHCALPCLALGTNVLLLKTGLESWRVGGLVELFRAVSVEELLAGRGGNLDSPEPNDSAYLPLRESLEAKASAFVAPDALSTGEADDTTGIGPEARFQTLAAIHGRRLAEWDALRQELQDTQQQLAVSNRERQHFEAEFQRLDEETRQMRASPSWRLTLAFKAMARRFPWAAARLRRLLARWGI